MKMKFIIPVGLALAANMQLSAQTWPATAHNLATNDYTFTTWANTNAANTAPASMRFYFLSTTGDPIVTDTIAEDYTGAYNLTSGTRILGEGSDGVSFINTGSSSLSANGYKLGAAVLAINTTGRSGVRVSWTGKTVTPNNRNYLIRLYYRVGNTGAWSAVTDASNNYSEYVRNATGGHTANIPAFTLPNGANNQALVQLQWKYFQVDTNTATGSRAQLAVGNISVTSSPLALASNIVTNVASLDFDTAVNAISSIDSIQVSGGNISSAIDLTTAAPFEIATTINGTYGNTLSLPATSDTVEPTYVYVRYVPTIAGTQTGTVSLSAGTTIEQVTLNGTAYESSNPTPAVLSQNDYVFNAWSATAAAGTFPPHTAFQYNTEASPFVTSLPFAGDWHCGYDLSSRARFNGLDDKGISFLNTGSAQYDDCASGANTKNVFVGGMLFALNTQNIDSAKMDYTIQLLTTGDGAVPRQYEVRLQYRNSLTEPFEDFSTPILFSSVGKTALDSAKVSMTLPATMMNHANVQVRWIYTDLNEAGASGSRPSFRIDDVKVARIIAPISVIDLDVATISLYPNPVKAGQNIYFTKEISAKVYDLTGRSVAEVSNANLLNTNNFRAGMYFIKATDGSTAKIVVE